MLVSICPAVGFSVEFHDGISKEKQCLPVVMWGVLVMPSAMPELPGVFSIVPIVYLDGQLAILQNVKLVQAN